MHGPGTHDLFHCPALRPGVEIQQQDGGVALLYREQSCDLQVADEGRLQLLALLDDLQRAPASMSALRAAHPELAGTIPGLLEELDRLGLVTEASFELPDDALSGCEFNTRLRNLAQRAMRKRGHSRLYGMLSDGSAPRNVLIGYALEYYFLVRAAPGLIASALSHADSRQNQRSIQRFLVSELDHDQMLAESLASVDMEVEGLDHLQPLPSTFALCAALGVFARQHLLSFKSVLFLFEMPGDEFNRALVRCCERAGLDKGFWEPLLRHAYLNDTLGHDDITAELLQDISAISREEQLVVEKNLVLTIETMALQDEEIVDYYSRPDALMPRLYL
ncbi:MULTISPECIES: hypothetical protein [Chromobacterium]|uniref:Thiaminase-2/PQQC domain-containing protein n=2 Tax=Chromobacterium TaxID=535 RepID=A0ABS3GM42_9NEIS|nr:MULTISPECIES: hypothetical protein [Chromobacterium]AXT46764.1 hypothetical protein D1345_11420 [Chromobacterium rhizoryzae]MBK0414308.1 hypothetical protein [Chromobacterium haemolyticum]MBO0415687.1 hypothetical protein [Chromobacterium haemolyticum]MBO0498797.1 hypothetical protein [Chromobacterium haemolyticum]OQS38486.1 hypothetical protein B0T40_06015 [Chromobacterium haemolyticum]